MAGRLGQPSVSVGDDSDEVMYTEVVYLDEEEQEQESNEEMVEQFYCSSCDINIPSVEEHIQEFHYGENIVVEVPASPKPLEFVKLEPIDITDEIIDGVEDDQQPHQRDLKLVSTSRKRLSDSPNPVQRKVLHNCKQCISSFTSIKSLSAHMRVHKTHTNKVIKKHTAEPSVKKETALVEEKLQWVCNICNTEFTSLKSLKLHGRMHNPIKQRTFEEAAGNEMKFLKHSTSSEMFFCDLCDKSYNVSLKEMHDKMHSNEETFMCVQCNKKFTDAEHLELHLRAHNEARVIQTKAELRNIRLPYACQYCNKEFARPHEKVKHERIHTGEKPYSCEVCGKTFRVAYCLTLHMRTHTDARPFVCAQCNKRFKSNSVYNHHLLTHSNVRGYQCPYCPKTFKTSVQLSGHKNSHTKPFSCTECNRPFATLYAVKIHMQSHQKTNHSLKHTCTICGATYARGFALKDHIKEQHGEVGDELGQQEATSNDMILPDMDEETEIAGQSILPHNDNGEEITIGEINQYENEEVVTDWLNK
ncbi:Endothelial zinc finger protein induced by tumor necrosis factor alpha [Pseudolycoriella hygida]|uniref:Endothelial zinc finger protein induced by tumor necrosis factor alpha n=1 Tax=Pseudolycoriella hygida TaxID=35572 RepID=A0A9Q0N834_9DIPT|nr:Endothelial zinc finger protein induced by tumor necrosis factor alpha [Pseudolycoriella hygida]